MSKRKNSQRKEIIWNLINSGISGTLVLLGALTTGGIDVKSFCVALITALIVAVTQFKDYWKSEEKEYSSKNYGFMKIL
jgi:hypothetical protein